MHTDETSAVSSLPNTTPKPHRRRVFVAFTGIAALSGIGFLTSSQSSAETASGLSQEPQTEAVAEPPKYDVLRPTPGGLTRRLEMTGTIEPFESTELFARVPGYLKSSHVEIGDVVRQGQILAELDAPELLKDVERCRALLQQAESRVIQSEARLATSRAERLAKSAQTEQVAAQVAAATAQTSLQSKMLTRIRNLADQNAVEQKLVDEHVHRWESAKADEQEAEAAAAVAEAELVALDTRIQQAEADLKAAEADVRVARAELARAEVLSSFTAIKAPFDGVVTQRNFDRGAFVRPATAGAKQSLFRIARTDHMRVVVRIPNPDVPFVQSGQSVQVQVDGLLGQTLEAKICRVAQHQDRRTRTMRAEIDLPNTEGNLVAGMYGSVTLTIPALPDAVTIPESSIVARTHPNQATVVIIKDEQQELRPVTIGRTADGQVEVLSNLKLEDVLLSNPPS
ncbi:efflux RND transporter periplasmic adaptor subunit [Thalassoroseus pseudoceratinae]|uniref:efflux RND transporter periplasmic adaptor subunit n=1 Tax=Thalassoroseus pseudoceratinae TaxID=2713176 RepID=UPI001422B2FD|nr:efflux RND transporter periplasmic adaptor subunit [Thalassoroseus pseudoceratinae]